jgi:hypothetical protein
MQCERCEGEISDTAKACKHCGADTAVGRAERREKRAGPARVIFVIAACVAITFMLIFLVGLANPRTDVQRCIDHKADGNWVASSGVTLEEFCKGSVALQSLEADRKAHPENY